MAREKSAMIGFFLGLIYHIPDSGEFALKFEGITAVKRYYRVWMAKTVDVESLRNLEFSTNSGRLNELVLHRGWPAARPFNR